MAGVGRTVKESMIETLGEHLSQQPHLFVTTVNRLAAPEADQLRHALHASQARLVIIKRRLGQRAVAPLKIAGLAELLEGSIGFVLAGGEALPLAKLLVEFQKTHEEHLVVRGALLDGQLLDWRHVAQLATLPPKPALLTQVVLTVESPLADVMLTIERLIGDLMWHIEQVAAKHPATSPPEAAASPTAASSEAPSPKAETSSTTPNAPEQQPQSER